MNKNKIMVQDVEKVASLARLKLSPKERETFGRQLDDILFYMKKLNELDTKGVEPLTHVLDLKNVFRKDEVRPGLARPEFLKDAPEQEDGFVKVPPVLE